ncbi:hypothetical protein [Rhodopirellula baltica]
MSDFNPPPPIKPIFSNESSPPEKEPVQGKENFDKAAEDALKPKLSTAELTFSPDGAIEHRGSTRISVAEKDIHDSKLPDTRAGKQAPRKVEFDRLGRHFTNEPENSPSRSQ